MATEAEFTAAYRLMSEIGKCDGVGSMEYKRTLKSWREDNPRPTVTYNDVDSTTKATMVAAAMVNCVHPDDRTTGTYEDAANAAIDWIDSQGVGMSDTDAILANLAAMFDAHLWDF